MEMYWDGWSFPQGLMSWKTKVVPYSNYVRVSPTQKGIRATVIVQLKKAARGLRSSEDKGLMCICQTPIVGWPWITNWGLLVRTCWEKEQDVAGEGDCREIGQHFSGTNILVLLPGYKHSIAQCKCRSEVKKQVWTVEQRETHYGVSRPPSPEKHPDPFPERFVRRKCVW